MAPRQRQVTNLPLALYVHLPWCVRKCPYCDFNSHEITGGSFPEQEYVKALVRDLEFSVGALGGNRLETVFLGGGTPSLVSPTGIGAILEAAASRSGLAADAEITLEANPGASDGRRFADYRDLGVNRLSIGVQSFNDDSLKALCRIHTAADARAALAMATKAGFANINIDLMYGLPGQSVQAALSDLAAAVNLEPAHISWYQLTIEPNTVFHARPPSLPDDDSAWEMYARGCDYLARHGYRRYEVSAWSRPGSECRHNLNYWQFGDYLGIGAGAHGKLTTHTDGGAPGPATLRTTITRQSRRRVPARYIHHAGTDAVIAERRMLTQDDCILEFMLNALRLKDGVPLSGFSARTGLEPDTIAAQVEAARSDGLLEPEPGLLRATEKGARYLNDLLQYFMP